MPANQIPLRDIVGDQTPNRRPLFDAPPSGLYDSDLTAGQQLGRIGLAGLRETIALPANISDAPVGLANLLAYSTLGKTLPFRGDIVSHTLGLPSSERVQQEFRTIAEQAKLDPEAVEKVLGPSRGGIGGFAEQVAGVLPGFIVGGGANSARQAALRVAQAAGAVGAKKGAEQFSPQLGRLGPLAENLAFVAGSMVPGAGRSLKFLKEKAIPAYAEFEEMAPKIQMGTVNTLKSLNKVNDKLRPTLKGRKIIGDKIAAIEDMLVKNIKTGQYETNMSTASTIIQDINELYKDLDSQGRKLLPEIKAGLEADMKAADPNLYGKFRDAQDLYKGIKDYEKAKIDVNKRSATKGAVAAFGPDLLQQALPKLGMLGPLGAAGKGYAAYQAGKYIFNTAKDLKKLTDTSSIAKQYYHKIIAASAQKNLPAISRNLEKLGRIAEKKGFTPQEEGVLLPDGRIRRPLF